MKIRKTVLAITLSALALGNCFTCLAAEAVVPPISSAQVEDGISPHAEETVWCTRWHNGKQQKRLWSITNSCWLTDWIDME